ncbi:uncharacterized protein HMPREF1541_06435 [Cyphellophora europaea CBS 101466]|uniref:DNA-directed RNA polymerase RBP11-like dimerisation domain-containing protein n=1 Tax=Cyphellophora europaea (strain CBS 101466) TaxID=1220924 RepID=W2RQ35_CYPE1|nr:uncharacterized protein HMPREF1541_06435 [Cyphellophora europaea CBS 101466]ETN38400.1 hypothetical protein HMPREF1541_06435 [Cyphellophora europaea CBS 101466]
MEADYGSGHAAPGNTNRWNYHPANAHHINIHNVRNRSATVDPPKAHEFWTLKPGEKKVEHEPDTRTANTEIFTLRAEDHTMGNLIRDSLLAMPEVTFAAYKCPHPLDNRVIIRVQVDPKSDMRPVDAFKVACEEAIKNLEIFLRRFKTSYDLTRMSQENQGQGNA